MKNFNLNTLNNDEWLTPPELIQSLGSFDLDVCSPIDRPWNTAAHHYTTVEDGLVSFWYGRVWCNPPYGRHVFEWLQKLSEHKSGMALIFARVETVGFHEQIWDKAHSIFAFKGRLHFYQRFWQDIDDNWWSASQIIEANKKVLETKEAIKDKTFPVNIPLNDLKLTGRMKWDNPTPANAPSVLVSYSERDTQAIADAQLKGRLIIL